MAQTQIWQRDSDNKLFHNDCFEEGESKEGYSAVKRDDLEADDECESCGGVFLAGFFPDTDDDDDDEDDDC